MKNNELFLKKATALLPEPKRKEVFPLPYERKEMAAKDTLLIDFGNHYVGYVTLDLGFTGSHPDAPVWLKIQFAEHADELKEDVEQYHGWISKGWIQTEQIHVDELPCRLSLPRRYAFRYVKITALDVSMKFRLTVNQVSCQAVSSADESRLEAFCGGGFAGTEQDILLDKIACRTLHNCMQTVFEDGPKRDRRLWIGDLRLEALANYQTYHQNDMVKACLYLFAGSTYDNGQVSACIFLNPQIEADDTKMFDYSLLFIAALRDYWKETGDWQTLCELYPTAVRQWEIAGEQFDRENLVRDGDSLGWCFVDWNLKLNKQASAQAIYIYCAKALEEMTREICNNCAQHAGDMQGNCVQHAGNIQGNCENHAENIQKNDVNHVGIMQGNCENHAGIMQENDTQHAGNLQEAEEKSKNVGVSRCEGTEKERDEPCDHAMTLAEKVRIRLSSDIDDKEKACEKLYDEKKHVYVSGREKQISWASQIWMVLAGVDDGCALDAVEDMPEVEAMVTPYIYHHYIEALAQSGRKDRALQVLRTYWGGMADQGADTFWEMYNPENPNESPYGGTVVNSYCHAWSCAPAYFLRKWNKEV
ncbi:MAG: sugar hydrolase [Lachnospiraceae bacterium]|nr:sugar hydrolase [Lachnospiraceae bacterium]